MHWGDGNTNTYSTNGVKTHTYADGPNDYAITVDLVDEDGTSLDRANALLGARRQRRAVDRDQRRGERQRGLGLQPDPGCGDRSGHRHGHRATSSTGATATATPTAPTASKTHTYADGPNDHAITVDLVDEDGTFLDRANALSVHGRQRRAVDRDQRRGERQRGLGLQPDPGCGHRSGHRHGHRAASSTGATAARNTYSTNGVKTHTYADGPNNYAITVDLVDEDGTFLDRANALSVHVDNVAPSIAISGAASVNEGSAYSLTLGAVTDPGTDTVTSYIVHWGDGNSDTYAHATASRRTPTPTARTTTTITVDLVDEDGTFLDRANALSVHVNNVAPTIAISGATSVNEGSAVQPDAGRGHRPGHRHGHAATIVHWGDGNTDTYVSTGVGSTTHLRRRPEQPRRSRVDLVDEDGTYLDRPTRSRSRSTTSRRRSRSAARPASTRARPTA